MDIVWLGEPACADHALTGGKAAALSALVAVGNVPPGFCLTATAAARWWPLVGDDGAAPPGLRPALAAAYRALAARCGEDAPPVAVRSSATDEDGATASFAGQHESYLNVVGADDVADAVARCWRSGRSERAVAYRRQNGLPPPPAGLPVLVQQLVVADASAVAFSTNPVTGDHGEVVIDAAWGLGESLVGGTVTPDTFVVRKADLAITARHPAEKRAMTIPAAAGTRAVAVPRFLRHAPALDDAQVLAIARLALALEARCGHPIDAECAYREGQLYLLQCRPVTALRRGAAIE
ncbi:MAG TPA: PEP/pyruvate-binding domain-containing protein [Thermomicrobiales bacterium]|nr:PEP/pyruvate-binding domain-containing protein [Thermomicrobiales bacterium]